MVDLSSASRTAQVRSGGRRRPARFSHVLLAVIACLFAVRLPANSSPCAGMEAVRVLWDSVELHDTRFGTSVSVRVELTRLPASGIEKSFLAAPRRRPVSPSGPEVLLLDVRTRIEPPAIPAVTLLSRVWFSPREALPLQRFRSRRGEDDYDQTFRFTHEGVFRLQVEPRAPAEVPLGPEGWSKKSESFYVYPGIGGFTETSLLLYILSAAQIDTEGAPLELDVFNRRQFHRVALRAGAPRSLPTELILSMPNGEAKVLRSVEAFPVRFVGVPLDPKAKEREDFSFLGLKGEVVLYLEKESRLPVQVSGEIPGIGRVEMRASEIKFRAPNGRPASVKD